MHKIRVFLNKKASSAGKAPMWAEKIRRLLFRSELVFVEPEDLEDLKVQLDAAVKDRVDLIISVGGDGTANTLIQHLGKSQTAFLIIPTGTANDLANELGIVGRIDRTIRSVRQVDPMKIDLIKVNQRFMATNGGIGLAADVAERVNRYREEVPLFKKLMRLSRARVYSAMLASEFVNPRLPYFDVEIESEEFCGTVSTPMFMINNQAVVGKVFRVAPETRNNDGTFNVTAFCHPRRLHLLRCVRRIRMGQPFQDDPSLVSFETRACTIKLAKPQVFYGDGEVFEKTDRFEITSHPLALSVYGDPSIHREIEGGFGR